MTFGYSDFERLCLRATWADDAADRLAADLNRGQVSGSTPEARDMLDTLHDGLRVLADTLHSLTLPYPPPSISPSQQTHLRVVE